MDLRSGSLTSRTCNELRVDILRCRLRPGARIRMTELQQRFGASLSVVREALSRLSSEGLVVALDQRGFRVAELSVEDLDDLVATRRRVETLALRVAMETGDAYWEAAVSAAYAELVRQDQLGGAAYAQESSWVEAHNAFHHSLIEGCRSPWLMRLCDQLATQMQRYRYLAVDTQPHRDAPVEHKAIVQAVLSRDADRAVAVLDQHFAETARILRDAIPAPVELAAAS